MTTQKTITRSVMTTQKTITRSVMTTDDRSACFRGEVVG